jgi:drug/metabolite transporter (DMT)-like permease
MQFVSAFGFIVVCIGALARTRATEKINPAGRFYALVSGVLLALGGICLYASYRTGYDASVTTALTSLYPMVTVLCAFVFLREKLNGLQVIGLFFAAAAMFILSL